METPRFTLQALNKELSDKTSGNGRPPGNVAAEVKAVRDDALAQYRQAMASHGPAHQSLSGLCLG